MGRIEQAFGSLTRIAVLRVSAGADEEMTGRGIWEAVKAASGPSALSTVQRAVDELVGAGVLKFRKVPGSNAKLYRLDRENPFVTRGILPLLELDQPVGDPAAALKSVFAGQGPELGVYKVALQDPETTPGELVLHFVARTGDNEVERRIRSMAEYVGKQVGRRVRLAQLSFQESRDRAQADPEFRRLVVEQGTLLAGSSFASSF